MFIYRPPDQAQSFDIKNSSKLRFSRHSPCDFFIYNGKKLWTVECKTFSGSCSFERSKEEKGIIHYYQIETLLDYSKYRNIISGFLLDFRKSDNTYFLEINDFCKMINSLSKKSFNETDMLNMCKPFNIDKKKNKINYKYNLERLFTEYKEEEI